MCSPRSASEAALDWGSRTSWGVTNRPYTNERTLPLEKIKGRDRRGYLGRLLPRAGPCGNWEQGIGEAVKWVMAGERGSYGVSEQEPALQVASLRGAPKTCRD
ncbi:hypothetical protein AG1IA_03799 [Rhizoctonia solani AG-1 IA]|uniref:Uncharacterized protein n=1 Tax=Thanatephorus cucumeris (strain AG1-IA) TaxID=983506 RepID=L8WVQ0_THACA|nr:hypothetical protein AG1IA_03799 [Rhizoctonia solani AG-1 IA]